jgi:hypothetical protein
MTFQKDLIPRPKVPEKICGFIYCVVQDIEEFYAGIIGEEITGLALCAGPPGMIQNFATVRQNNLEPLVSALCSRHQALQAISKGL